MTGKITGALREQSDWEQNDEHRLGFIKNKPFSKRIERKTILPETILNGNAGGHEVIIDGETIQCSNHTIELNENIKANATYIVTYDGIDYILNSYEMYFIWGKVIGIGNGALGGYEVDVQNREFPFFIENNYENEELLNSRCTYIGNDEHVLKIEQDEIVYEKLDTGYFPDEIRSDWNQNDPSAMNYIKNRPFYETDKIYGKVEIEETTLDTLWDEEANQWGAIVPYKGYFSSSNLIASMYEVVVDGIEYVLPYTQVYSSAGYIGVEDINTSQKYPFSFWTVNGYGGTIDWRLVFATGGQHTVKITQIVKNGEVKTLDPKFLPTTKVINANEYGIDIPTIGMSGEKMTIVNTEPIFEEINKHQNFVIECDFDTSKITLVPTAIVREADGTISFVNLGFEYILDGVIIHFSIALVRNNTVICTTNQTPLN